MKYINKIGYEIEGLWSNDYWHLESQLGGDFTNDGSISIGSGDIDGVDEKDFWDNYQEKEYRSKPRSSIRAIKKDLKVIKRYFAGANETCGFHIHVSFKKDTMFSLIASKSFNDYFVNKVAAMFPEMFEIRKHSSYCKPEVRSKREVVLDFLSGDGDRYKAVNFNSRREHSTVEFRIFDMNIDMALDYIQATIKIIQDYLDVEKIKQKVVKRNVYQPITKKTIYV